MHHNQRRRHAREHAVWRHVHVPQPLSRRWQRSTTHGYNTHTLGISATTRSISPLPLSQQPCASRARLERRHHLVIFQYHFPSSIDPTRLLLPFTLLTTLILPLASTAPTSPLHPRVDPHDMTVIDIQMMTRIRFPLLHASPYQHPQTS
jgi:hypothetical protein